jgi:hypothetical protein
LAQVGLLAQYESQLLHPPNQHRAGAVIQFGPAPFRPAWQFRTTLVWPEPDIESCGEFSNLSGAAATVVRSWFRSVLARPQPQHLQWRHGGTSAAPNKGN